jgi:hypothetical protein
MPTIRTSAISESGIVFFASGGHSHDGVGSSIIDTSKYSIFDFGFGLVGTNPDRINKQTINQTAFKNFIIQTVNESVLEPAGVVLQDNIINSRNIIAGSITSTEIAANTITANNIATGTITATQIAAGSITADRLEANALSANSLSFSNGDYWASNGAFRLGGTSGVSYSGVLGSSITIGSNTVVNGSIDIGGPDNASLQVNTDGALWIGHRDFASAPFRVYSNGRTEVGNGKVTISTTGVVNITGATTVGGNLTVNGSSISIGSVSSTTDVNGDLVVNGNTVMESNVRIDGAVRGNNGIVYWKLDTSGFIAGTSLDGTQILSIGQNINTNGTVTAAGNVTTQASLLVGSGTAGAPSIRFTSDTDTGMYRSGTNQVGISCGGGNSAFFTPSDTLLTITSTGTAQTVYHTSLGLIKASSTRNIKNDIYYFSDGIEKIKKLKPVTFTYKPLESDSEYTAELKKGAIQHGFIAEEVAEADHQLATWDLPNMDGLTDEEKIEIIKDLTKYVPTYYKESAILSIAVAAIQELTTRVEALEAQLGYNN